MIILSGRVAQKVQDRNSTFTRDFAKAEYIAACNETTLGYDQDEIELSTMKQIAGFIGLISGH